MSYNTKGKTNRRGGRGERGEPKARYDGFQDHHQIQQSKKRDKDLVRSRK